MLQIARWHTRQNNLTPPETIASIMNDRGPCRPERVLRITAETPLCAGLLQRFFQALNRFLQLFIRWRYKRHAQRRMIWLVAVEKLARHKYYAVT